MGEGGLAVTAPIAPGLMRKLRIRSYASFGVENEILVSTKPAMVALDGEREFQVGSDEQITVRVNRHGPIVLEITKALELATRRAFSCESRSRNAAFG
jgi:hypothetical protein